MRLNANLRRLWKLLSGILQRSENANLSLVAAGGAFFAMLSLFPGIAALIALVGVFADPAQVGPQLELLEEFMPGEAYDVIQDQVTRLVTANPSTLGWTSVLSTGAALWSARRGTDALIRAMNAIYDVPQRGGLRANLVALAMTGAFILAVSVAALALLAIPVVIRLLTLDVFVEVIPQQVIDLATSWVLVALRWSVAGGVVFGGIWILYRFAPNGAAARVHFFSAGALLAIGVWLPASWGFSHYLSFVDAYSGVYGSIGAIIALLMFLYLTISSILLGATLNAELAASRRAQAIASADARGALDAPDPA